MNSLGVRVFAKCGETLRGDLNQQTYKVHVKLALADDKPSNP